MIVPPLTTVFPVISISEDGQCEVNFVFQHRISAESMVSIIDKYCPGEFPKFKIVDSLFI